MRLLQTTANEWNFIGGTPERGEVVMGVRVVVAGASADVVMEILMWCWCCGGGCGAAAAAAVVVMVVLCGGAAAVLVTVAMVVALV